jgi:hypothetical protein
MSSVWSHTGNAADNIVGPLVVRERPRETIDIALLASSSKHFVKGHDSMVNTTYASARIEH